jgi:menaquinol-cytochrome c reductase iron-sulfur subunit
MQEKPNLESNAKPESRRIFLKNLSLTTIVLGTLGQLGTLVRSLVPNVLYEPPTRLKLGLPDDFVDGVQFLEDKKLYLFKQNNQFYCITAVCTHLGCTVKYTAKLSGAPPWEFHCPCHGSKFNGNGVNYAGPAPKPLQWYQLELAQEDGQLVVDFSREVDRNFRLTV